VKFETYHDKVYGSLNVHFVHRQFAAVCK